MTVRKKMAAEAMPGAEGSGVPPIALVEFGAPDEREPGWAIVSEAMAGGWRSVGPYGPRADYYDRP